MKRTLIAVGLAALLLLGGCLGFVLGDDIAFEADPATVDSDTLDKTGYARENVTDSTVNESVSLAGETREISLKNWQVMYSKSVQGSWVKSAPVSKFITFTTPHYEVGGSTISPFANVSNEALMMVALGDAAVSDVEEVDQREITTLNKTTNVTKFRVAVDEGSEYLPQYQTDVYIHVTKVQHQSDDVVAVGVYPTELNEDGNILEMMQTLQHGGPTPEDENEAPDN